MRDRRAAVPGADSTVTKADWEGQDISGRSHTRVSFVDLDMTEATNHGAVFTECTCKLVGSTFDRCTFELMKVDGGNWSHVGLIGAELGAATFTDVRMREVDLTNARLEDASLRGGDLAEATFRGAKLDGCDLRGSDLGAVDLEGVELAGAIITAQQAVTLALALGLDVRAD